MTEQQTGRRAGRVATVVVNLVVMWVVNQLPEWEWPPFLTPEFEDLLPYINASIIATIVVNVVWLVRDPPVLEHLGQIVLNGFSFVAAVRTWQLFPFDFSRYSFDWELIARILIGLGLFGLAVATIVEVVGFARSLARSSELSPDSR